MDALSRPIGTDAEAAPKETSLIPPSAFLNLVQLGDGLVEEDIAHSQVRYATELRKLASKWLIQRHPSGLWEDAIEQVVIPPQDEALKWRIIGVYHDGAGHPGHDKTLRRIHRRFCWFQARPWIKQYIKGCATCQ